MIALSQAFTSTNPHSVPVSEETFAKLPRLTRQFYAHRIRLGEQPPTELACCCLLNESARHMKQLEKETKKPVQSVRPYPLVYTTGRRPMIYRRQMVITNGITRLLGEVVRA